MNRRIETLGNYHMNRTMIPALVIASLIAVPAFAADTTPAAKTDKPAAAASDTAKPAKKAKKAKKAPAAKKTDAAAPAAK
jgi:hypothetical protein